ncbi:MAG: acetolactate decarboxylase [Burkholderiales bacterium]|nr:acetolactate decarboxylase [Burkholderiales bacterium]
MGNMIYQTGTINSLLEAVYDGDKTVAQVMQHGDFGLGTFDFIDGEFIACDGVCYRADMDGVIAIAEPAIKTPFAVVSKFNAHKRLTLSNLSFQQLEHKLEEQFNSRNIVYAIKVIAKFKQISFRSEACPTRSKLKLSELLPKIQRSFTRDNVEGILVGVWYPKYMANINVSGFHFHFVDSQRQFGGHVFAFDLLDGEAQIQEIHSLQIDLINTTDFHNADLDQDHSDAVASVEKMR